MEGAHTLNALHVGRALQIRGGHDIYRHGADAHRVLLGASIWLCDRVLTVTYVRGADAHRALSAPRYEIATLYTASLAGAAPTLIASYRSAISLTSKYVFTERDGTRRQLPRFLTRRECAALMGFPRAFVLQSSLPYVVWAQFDCTLILCSLAGLLSQLSSRVASSPDDCCLVPLPPRAGFSCRCPAPLSVPTVT